LFSKIFVVKLRLQGKVSVRKVKLAFVHPAGNSVAHSPAPLRTISIMWVLSHSVEPVRTVFG